MARKRASPTAAPTMLGVLRCRETPTTRRGVQTADLGYFSPDTYFATAGASSIWMAFVGTQA